MYETILVPTDDSPAAEDALEHAVSHAKRYGATLTLLAVVELSGTAAPERRTESAVEQRRRSRRESVEELAEGVADDVDVSIAVRTGTPSRAILEYVGEHDVDLIVMSTHARSGVGRFLYGSITERVIRDGDAPVLAIQR